MAESENLVPLEQPVVKLASRDAFNLLKTNDKLYARYFSAASWYGSLICLQQTSKESPLIFELFQITFSDFSYTKVRGKAKVGEFPEKGTDMHHFYNYATCFYGNMGNFLSFGDRKFIPRIPVDKFWECIELHLKHVKGNWKKSRAKELWEEVEGPIYDIKGKGKVLGKPHEATTGYYSEDIKPEDVELVKDYMASIKMEAWNTRLFKDGDVLEIRCAGLDRDTVKDAVFKCKKIRIVYSDYGHLLRKVVDNLHRAEKVAANETQVKMLQHYRKHFETGELDYHKDSQREWIKDIGPAVETNIGFIENYRDGYGERAEWEGLVACVNKAQSKKFSDLVDLAEILLPKLPWPKEFEKDAFTRPDFTALEVITFAGSGCPVGINIPNYDEIRENDGFKNVHLHNVLTSRWDTQKKDPEPVPFIAKEDMDDFKNLRVRAFEVQVGLHELLGHGSGRLLKTEDIGKIHNPVTGKKVATAYGEGQTWSSEFGALASSFEECRAEAVGIYLCLEEQVLNVFNIRDKADQEKIIAMNWLLMIHSGLSSLEMYYPDKQKWGQAHSHARFAILRVLLDTAPGLVTLKEMENDMEISIDKSKIKTIGKKAIGDFLVKLNVFKATKDVKAAEALWDKYTTVDAKWLKRRDIVISKKKPRHVLVQAHLMNDGNRVDILEFSPTPQGMFLSMQYHFGPPTQPRKPRAVKLVKVKDLLPNMRSVDVNVEVVSVDDKEAVVGDETGVITVLPRKPLKVGQGFEIRNGFVVMKNNRMRLRLSGGNSPKDTSGISKVDTSNDLSAVEYEMVKA